MGVTSHQSGDQCGGSYGREPTKNIDDNDKLDDDDYDRVDQQELDDILSDRPDVDDTNPTGNDDKDPVEDGPAENNEADEADEAEIRSVTDSEGTEARRSGRTRSQPERLAHVQPAANPARMEWQENEDPI